MGSPNPSLRLGKVTLIVVISSGLGCLGCLREHSSRRREDQGPARGLWRAGLRSCSPSGLWEGAAEMGAECLGAERGRGQEPPEQTAGAL